VSLLDPDSIFPDVAECDLEGTYARAAS
jgi:hypothetical protein